MYVKVSRGFRPSCKNRGASALRGFCPTGLLSYNHFLYRAVKYNLPIPKAKISVTVVIVIDTAASLIVSPIHSLTLFLKLV